MSDTGPARPVIIVGTGRCGSTMLHRLLARHDDLGWLSPYNEVLPAQTWLSALSPLYRLPIPERIRHLRAFPKPFEAYRFWEHYLPGFSRRDRPQTSADVPAEGIEPVRAATTRVLRFQRRDRLLVKVTGWARMRYFDRIFPGSLFISLTRDPRSVVSSWAKAGWLDVTSPPDGDQWQWGAVPDPYMELWRELGGGPILSVALKMRLDLDDIAANAAKLPGRVLEIKYEDLIANPEGTLRAVCEFTSLAWTGRFERMVAAVPIYDPTEKWRQHLTAEEGQRVLEFMARADRVHPSSTSRRVSAQ